MYRQGTKQKKPGFKSESCLAGSTPESGHVLRMFSFAGADEKKLALNYVKCGSITYQQLGGEPFRVRPQDFYLCDRAIPARIASDAAKIIEMILPRRLFLPESVTPLSAGAASKAIHAGTLTAMLRDELEALHTVFDNLDEGERAASLLAVEAVATGVVRAALSAMGDAWTEVVPRSGRTHREDFFIQACYCIESNLADPDLGSAWIARTLGCSRATLYRVFSEHGLTVANYIRNERLDRLRLLLETASSDAAIGELAASCGLYDSPNLSRSFRARYHMTPSEARSLAIQ